MVTKKNLIAVVLTAICLFPVCVSASPYVQVNEGTFYLNDSEYRFLGVNYWYACYLGAEIEQDGRGRLVKELDELKELGVDNLRILGASEESRITTLKPAIQTQPGVYNEDLLVGLDFALNEMSKRGMKAVVFLNDTWKWSGGMSQYLYWSNGKNIPEQNKEWFPFISNITNFYKDSYCQELYRRYIKMLLNRKNTINGRIYKEDPTIMAWQLANEPRPGAYEESDMNLPVFIEWIGQTADYIRGLGAKQLISTGSEGIMGCNGSVETFESIHAFESIDYLTAHFWPLNWNHFDPENPEKTFQKTIDATLEYVKRHIEISDYMNKPLVLEEFGLPRDFHDYSPTGKTTYRDKYFKQVFESLFYANPVEGINIWSWGGLGGANAEAGEMWQPGDEFTGDNPVEPHGRNSVYSTDASTIELLRNTIERIAE